MLFHARRLAEANDLFQHLAERCDPHYSPNIAFIEKPAWTGSYIAFAEWPRTSQPEVPGRIADERPPARPPLAVDRDQRLLRRRRVRARAQPPRQDRTARRRRRIRGGGRGRAARQDRRIPLRLPDRDPDGLDRHRLSRRALALEADRAGLRRAIPRRRGGGLA